MSALPPGTACALCGAAGAEAVVIRLRGDGAGRVGAALPSCVACADGLPSLYDLFSRLARALKSRETELVRDGFRTVTRTADPMRPGTMTRKLWERARRAMAGRGCKA